MPLAACAWTRFPTRRADRGARTHAYRLTAAKEEGATIEIEGKKVALPEEKMVPHVERVAPLVADEVEIAFVAVLRDGSLVTNPKPPLLQYANAHGAGPEFFAAVQDGFFVGQVMKATKGQANPALVNDTLKKLLEG